jgi:hypothetical protein
MFLTVLIQALRFGSLPPDAVPSSTWVPGVVVPTFSINLQNGSTFTYQYNGGGVSTSTRPLVVFALNASAPFASFMANDNSSVDAFLASLATNVSDGSAGGRAVDYAFLAHVDAGETAKLATKLDARMAAQAIPESTRAAMRERWLFANETVAMGDAKIAGMLHALPSATLTATLLRPGTSVTSVRLDCKYAQCSWPDPNVSSVPLFDGGDACATTPLPKNTAGKKAYVLLSSSSASMTTCAPSKAVRRAIKAGWFNVLVAAAPDAEYLVPIGAAKGDTADDISSASASMVGASFGATLVAAISSSSTASVNIALGWDHRPGSFAAIDGNGALIEVGWEKYDSLMMIKWAGDWLGWRAALATRLASPSYVIPVADKAPLDGKVAHLISMPPAALLRSFRMLELDFALQCGGAVDDDCSVWDHTITLTAVCADPSDNQEVKVRRLGEPGGDANELGRWVTAFKRRSGRWLTDATTRIPLLLGGSQCAFTLKVGGENWLGTLNLRFTHHESEAKKKDTKEKKPAPFAWFPLQFPNNTTKFDSPKYNVNRTLTFTPPAGVKSVYITALITGHGECEFRASSHHFAIDGVDVANSSDIAFDQYMAAGSPLGCAAWSSRGAVPNEHGTWYFGRNGWCDGLDVQPLVWDVSAAVLGANGGGGGGVQHTVTYHALGFTDGGEPTESGCGGYILLSSAIAYA